MTNGCWKEGFLEMKTFKDLINGRGAQRLITLDPAQTVSEAIDLMKKYDIENIPVMTNGNNIGAISAGGTV
jgi:cystathionine beta-synthase